MYTPICLSELNGIFTEGAPLKNKIQCQRSDRKTKTFHFHEHKILLKTVFSEERRYDVRERHRSKVEKRERKAKDPRHC